MPSPELPADLPFDRLHRAWDTFSFWTFMTLKPFTLALSLAAFAVLPVFGQAASGDSSPDKKMTPRADAYYNFTMGHLYELEYEQTSQPDFASKAIDAYKKAYALDPQSPIIGEHLAEMYWKAQRQREAVNEANEILKHNPDDLPTHRLLGRIYLRSLGRHQRSVRCPNRNGCQSHIGVLRSSSPRSFRSGRFAVASPSVSSAQ